jgi:uncharacterized protein
VTAWRAFPQLHCTRESSLQVCVNANFQATTADMTGLESIALPMVLWIALVLALAGFIQGTLGFGYPFVATPLITMVSDMRTAVIIVLLPTLVTTVVTLATSGSLRSTLDRFWMMPIYAMLGAIAGTGIFIAAPAAPYSLLLALLIIGYLNLEHIARGEWPLVRRHERAIAPVAGMAAGLFEGTANVAAPPLIIFYLALGLTPAMLVQALCICFVVGKLTQFVMLTAGGGVSAGQWLATLPYILVSMATFFVGLRIRNRINAQTYRIWVKRALLVIALLLLAQYGYQTVSG